MFTFHFVALQPWHTNLPITCCCTALPAAVGSDRDGMQMLRVRDVSTWPHSAAVIGTEFPSSYRGSMYVKL